MSDGKESSEPSMESRKFSKRIAALADYSKSKIQSGAVDLTARVRDFRAKSAIDAVLEAPDRFKREWQKHGATGAITKFPIATIVVFLLLTAFFVSQSGFLDDTRFDDEPGEPALNVNGDLEVYLPEGSQVAELIALVEDDWSTNVMIIYVESGTRNITDQRILQEMSYVEKQLNPYLSDSVNDDVIYILSLSTVLKEVNLKSLVDDINGYLKILNSDKQLLKVLKDELNEIKDNFATPRKTEIQKHDIEEVDTEDLIVEEDVVITVSHQGYIKRVLKSSYKVQKRGGKGKNAMTTRDEDFLEQVFAATTRDTILFFTSVGKVYSMKAYELPAGTPTSRGKAIVNLIPISKNEKISSILTLPKDIGDFENYNLVFATSLGNIRKNKLKDVAMSGTRKLARTGKTAIKLKTGDRLIGVISVIENDDVQLATTNGKSIRFATKDLREFSGLGSAGVRGIKLAKDDKVVSICSLVHNKISIDVRESYLKAKNEAKKDASKMNKKFQELAESEEYLLSITENGYGKLSSAYEYRITNRGGSGVTNITITPKNGRVVQSLKVNLDDNIALISDSGKLLRCNVGENIRVVGRVSQGVSVFKVDSKEKIVSVARLED